MPCVAKAARQVGYDSSCGDLVDLDIHDLRSHSISSRLSNFAYRNANQVCLIGQYSIARAVSTICVTSALSQLRRPRTTGGSARSSVTGRSHEILPPSSVPLRDAVNRSLYSRSSK